MALTKEEKIGLGILGAGATGLIAWGIYEAVKKPPPPVELFQKFLDRIRKATTTDELYAIREEFEAAYAEDLLTYEQYHELFLAYRERYGELLPPYKLATIIVEVKPPEIHPGIFIDDVYVGTAPVVRDVDPGKHIVSFEDKEWGRFVTPGVLYDIAPEPVEVDLKPGEEVTVVGEYTIVPIPKADVDFVELYWNRDRTLRSPTFGVETEHLVTITLHNPTEANWAYILEVYLGDIMVGEGASPVVLPCLTPSVEISCVMPDVPGIYPIRVKFYEWEERALIKEVDTGETVTLTEVPPPRPPAPIELIDKSWINPQPFAPGSFQPAVVTLRNNTAETLTLNIGMGVVGQPAVRLMNQTLSPGEEATFPFANISMPPFVGTFEVELWASDVDTGDVLLMDVQKIEVSERIVEQARPASSTLPIEVADPVAVATQVAQAAALSEQPVVEVAPDVHIHTPSVAAAAKESGMTVEEWVLLYGYGIMP